VLRVKNRFTLAYDSGLSAGYRDVGINLRVRTRGTRALGAAAHVCELQLILRPFAELKVRPRRGEGGTAVGGGGGQAGGEARVEGRTVRRMHSAAPARRSGRRGER
jgi:hypothetical protein